MMTSFFFTKAKEYNKNSAVSLLVTLIIVLAITASTSAKVNPQDTIQCHRREYTFRASKPMNGFECWDDITVMSCWGRCDSNEIGDYKFPYKISDNPVCLHGKRTSRLVQLRNCDEGHPDPYYRVTEAEYCTCRMCDTKSTNCETF